MSPLRVGIIGAGVISEQYLDNLTKTPAVIVKMIADIDVSRAQARAEQYALSAFGTPAEMLAREDIDLVVNLTIPSAHEEVTISCLKAGKHVWSEKPLALNAESVDRIQQQALASGLEVGCAPDTFLGPALQTGLRLIQAGEIGDLVGATTAFEVPGPESWHPNPDFLYARGGGPIFDMGPYYLTALVCALGPVSQVTARSSQARDFRTIGSGPRAGQKFPVEVPTNVVALIDFASGNAAQSSFSFDSAKIRAGVLEIHGTLGTIVIPDPNGFEGTVELYKADAPNHEAVLIPCEGEVMYRGVGVVDMAYAIRDGHRPRANIDLAGHVVEVMQALEKAAIDGSQVKVGSRPSKPELVSRNFNPWSGLA